MQCFKNPIFSALLETEVSQACDGRKFHTEKFELREPQRDQHFLQNEAKFQEVANAEDYFYHKSNRETGTPFSFIKAKASMVGICYLFW